MADWDNKAMKGSDIQSALTQVYTDMNVVKNSSVRGLNLSYGIEYALEITVAYQQYIGGVTLLVTMNDIHGNSYEDDYCSVIVSFLALSRGVTDIKMHVLACSDYSRMPHLYYHVGTSSSDPTKIYVEKDGASTRTNDTQVSIVASTLSPYITFSYAGIRNSLSSLTDGASSTLYNQRLVNVTSYTSYSSITAVTSKGAIPYYAHTDGSLVVDLMYVGNSTPTSPGQSVALIFCGVSNGSLYQTSFMDGDSAFGSVTKLSLFDSDRVLGSSNTSAWGGDEYNVPTRGAVFNMLNSVKHSHVEALKIPVNPELYGFVDVGLYDAIHDEPVLTPTTYSETRQTHFIASSDFSALIYTYGVWNPTIAYRCEEFYVNYEWTSAITQSLSLYDFFLNTPASSVYFRHFAITINNYCNYAMTLKIYGGNNHENDVDVYSNIANPTTQLNVAVAAKRVTRIDVRLLFNGVGAYSSKSAVVTVI